MSKIWWKEAVVYQIYPRSFYDSNGDGIGDLQGVIKKLDYIQSLGVDVVWLCPVYDSPNDDNGYDIRDYYAIGSDFGTMEDFDLLLEGIHLRGMKLIMDLVVNHTSDEHEWFKESSSSKSSPKRDFYFWSSGKKDLAPTNWQSFFGGDAWAFDELTEEYFLHLFTRKQPDLNWENPLVREEIYKLMTFWLEKGIDGFRMDVISLISKRSFEDSPFQDFEDTIEKVYANGPRIHEYLKEMNCEVLDKYDIMTVGEGPGIDLSNGIRYVSKSEKELDMIFHFDHMFIDHGPGGKFDPVPFSLVRFKEIFTLWDQKLEKDGWGSIFLGNHDFPRIVSRFGNDRQFHNKSAKLLALMLLSLRGTVYIYQGDEIGMTNVSFDSLDDYDDIEIRNARAEWESQGRDLDQLLKAVHKQGRDNARTPVQWTDQRHAGFTEGEPWLPVNSNYKSIHVAEQDADERSILNFYRKMISIRKGHPTLVYGDYAIIDANHPAVYAYWRWDETARYLVLLNFSDEKQSFEADDRFDCAALEEIIANGKMLSDQPQNFILSPWNGIIYKC